MTAIYFVGSALRARRYLSIGDTEGATTGAVANKTAMQRLMGRVLTSGCLMLVNVLTLAVGLSFLFHPVGFTICYTIGGLVTMANSILQLASFAPPAGAPAGPIEEVRLGLKKVARLAVRHFDGSASAESHRAGHKRLLFLIGEGPKPVVHAAAGKSRGGRRRSSFATGVRVSDTVAHVSVLSVSPEEPTVTTRSETNLPPCERKGVSYEFLLAVMESWKVPNTMKTYEFCERYIRPATLEHACCFTDRLRQTGCPEEWLGKMEVFVSHW